MSDITTKLCFLNKKINDIDKRTSDEILRMTELSSVALDFLGKSYFTVDEATSMFATKQELQNISDANSVLSYTKEEADQMFSVKNSHYTKLESDATYVSIDTASEFVTAADGISISGDNIIVSKSIVPLATDAVVGTASEPFNEAHFQALYVGSNASLVSGQNSLIIDPGKVQIGTTTIESVSGGDLRFTTESESFTLGELSALLSSNQQRLAALESV